MGTNLITQPSVTANYYASNGWTVVEVIGEVDVYSAPLIREAVAELIDNGHRHFVLDLGPTTFLDSMGLGMVVGITKRIRARDGSLLITSADEHVLLPFKIAGLRKVFVFHDCVEDATRSAPHGCGLSHWPQPYPSTA